MKHQTAKLLARNSVFAWIGFATLAVLLVPFMAMQFTTEVRWDMADFIVMGTLLFGMVSLYVLAARRNLRKHRILVGLLFVAAFVYIWAELAVGLFTD
jgi:hypothetical protein